MEAAGSSVPAFVQKAVDRLLACGDPENGLLVGSRPSGVTRPRGIALFAFGSSDNDHPASMSRLRCGARAALFV